MLAKTGLLIISNPTQIGNTLSSIQKHVKKTLYIQLLSALTDSFGSFHPTVYNTWPKHSQTVHKIYSQAASHCKNIDVRVLLSGLKYDIKKIKTKAPVDLVIFDKVHGETEINDFIKTKIGNIADKYDVLTIDSGSVEKLEFEERNVSDLVVDHSVLGGTFDRLHVAHKLLLSEALLRARKLITVGVTEENMLQNKLLWELIENTSKRLENVRDFVSDICPEVEAKVVAISDPFGPAIVDPTMDLIVVSSETLRGGEKINEIREMKGLNKLTIIPIELIEEPCPQPVEEKKISSSTTRIRLLGTLLKPVVPQTNLPAKPYIIGLTGGIASGKSGVAKALSELSAFVIDCDKIGHNVYKRGKPCYNLLVDHFGPSIVGEDGEVNRKVLGGIVFKDPEELKKLNSLVWPAIINEVNDVIAKASSSVVVIEAAVLLTAGWDKHCHEVWTTIVPREEAIQRLKLRNGLTEEQAISRIDSQPNNSSYVEAANVVFCPLWEYEFTKQQVKKAWDLLDDRITMQSPSCVINKLT